MSSERKDKNTQKSQEEKNDNDIKNNDPNYLNIDLYDEETLNISLEEEKPLFTKLYSNVNEKISSVKKEEENENEENSEFLTEFENLFKNQIDIINLCVKNNEPNFIYATNVLVAKIKIFNFFNTKYLEQYLNQSDLQSSKILSLINENLTNSVNKMIDIIHKLGQKANKIKEENEFITKKLINNNINIKSNQLNNIKNPNKNNKLKSKPLNNSLLKSKEINQNNNINDKNSQNKNINDKIKNQSINNNLQGYNIQNQNKIHNNVFLTNLSLAGNRVFTVKMMKEVISNIYTAKIAFDKKCIQNKQPKQTMEEFMYTYLNQKYGLKNMVIEWATNIINGIRTFSPEDTEISLFGKILQNELEENCQLLISNLKDNINSIILNILRSEYPYKNDIELNKMKNQIIKKEMPPEKTQQIVDALFDEKGKEILFNKINKEINNKKEIIMKNSKINGKYTREEYKQIFGMFFFI